MEMVKNGRRRKMKFVVERTSRLDEKKPCKEAHIESLTPIDIRTAKTLEEAQKKCWYKQWFADGVNHRVEDGCVVCDAKEKRPVWVIEINNLERLIAFLEEHGELVISTESRYKEIPHYIEIYDYYRE